MTLTNLQLNTTKQNVDIYSRDARQAVAEGKNVHAYIWTVFAIHNAKRLINDFNVQLDVLADLQNDVNSANSEDEKQELRGKFHALLMSTESNEAFSEDYIGYNNCVKLHPFLDMWFQGKL